MTKEEQVQGAEEYNKDGEEQAKLKYTFIIHHILFFALILLIAVILHRYVIRPVVVDGHSMKYTLDSGDHLLLEKVSYLFSQPKRFDIIVFRPYDFEKDTYYVKRIIGLPGETVEIEAGNIYINSERLEENYGKEAIIQNAGLASSEFILGKNEYFVLGDNRNSSKDSRDPEVGAVRRSAIIGRAWVRIWPLSDFGILEHQ